MSTYRKMRRQARLARRSGLQPMMVINAGEPFPETLGGTAGPVGVAVPLRARARGGGRCPGGGRLVAAPHPAALVAVLAVLTGVTAWAVALFGARWRFPTLTERIYAAVTIYVGGIWLSVRYRSRPVSVPLLRESLDNRRAYLVGALVGASAAARESRA